MKCLFCGESITDKQIKEAQYRKREIKYCSSKCGKLGTIKYKIYDKAYCKLCNKELTRKQIKNKNTYCSHKCANTIIGRNRNYKIEIERNKKISDRLKGNKNGEGAIFTEERKHNLRIARMKNMNDNKCFPSFNKTSIQYFNILNKAVFNDGQYGKNEYCIPGLGYWPDFISNKHKTIIEWDEKYHNKQMGKDKIRQQQIQAHYPDYLFIRINEKNAKINILANIFANNIRRKIWA